ncbi:MAG TPA: GntR family transcriptional regulator [Blastocatellia bacterium]|nr:GntR family transcriptional regulator [Blastocatellia bacterium]HMX27818.1 GntR family transcriptional regulator [Blastocatellia bacterium]HMY73137.1 GntR family transcriptional regulator [Blastocatellia bacterium]HMZ22955.1 GntR family transcriptional regulator [Blastocatellia bacterium]HNG32551.1 GntR family transcriptional regulator [Blastocatellia bacterium]
MAAGNSVRLDKSSFTPLYHQIEQALRGQIEGGELAPGQAISERELSEKLKVSRMTARQALHALREEGLIYTERGRGTFVAEQKMTVHTRQLLGFTEDMRRRGLVAASKILSFRRFQPEPSAAEKLRLEEGEEAFEIVRLRLADHVPMAIETCLLPVERCPELKRADVERGSLYQILEQSYGVRLGHADEVLEAACATTEEARLLSIKPRSPVLVVTRTVFATDDSIIEAVRSVYRGDRYQATIQLKRR